MKVQIMKTFTIALVCTCFIPTSALIPKLNRTYRTRSDSDSRSVSSDSSSVDSDDGPCFLTQTCNTIDNILETTQPSEFSLFSSAFESIPSAAAIVESLTFLVQDEINIIVGVDTLDTVDCFQSSEGGPLGDAPLRLNAKDSLAFSIIVENQDGNALVTIVFTDVPSSFGELSVAYLFDGIDLSVVPNTLSVTRQVRSSDGEVFDLFLSTEECSLSQPVVCGGEAPTDPPTLVIPTLPSALTAELSDAMAAVQGDLCPPL
eukprot:scpid99865/ scgid0388/ 